MGIGAKGVGLALVGAVVGCSSPDVPSKRVRLEAERAESNRIEAEMAEGFERQERDEQRARAAAKDRPGVQPVVTHAVNAFGFDLYGQLAGRGGNLVFSPASIAVALAMLHRGAHGDTATEIANVLHFDSGSDALHLEFGRLQRRLNTRTETFRTVSANHVWVDPRLPVEASFVAALKQHYGASTDHLDFGMPRKAEKKINRWIEKETQGLIKDMLDGALDERTRLVLTNAIYFKADWAKSFESDYTVRRDFHLGSGEIAQVPTMEGFLSGAYLETEHFRLAGLRYKGNAGSMLILLPNDSLSEVEPELSASNFKTWRADAQRRRLHVRLPKFELVHQIERLPETLPSLGVKLAFSDQADLSRVSSEDLYVDDVVHGAVVRVDERGTEAGAATVVEARGKLAARWIEFYVDRPFLFAVLDGNGTILFLGRVMDPR